MDILSSEARSALMSRIRGKNTKPELVVRHLLHSMGYRFRLHRRDLPGTPDLVLPKYRLAFLVHGCFFHHHGGCRLAYVPKTRTDFWREKFSKNIERDRKVQRALRAAGWTPIVIWECETERPADLVRRFQKIFS
jgi:DNA mismatch endonuclease, patch repair protein